jgi:hypothetical protein
VVSVGALERLTALARPPERRGRRVPTEEVAA